MTRLFWKIFWKLSGWKIQGELPGDLRQCIILVAPHTSAWDVVMGMAVRAVMPIRDAHFLGKKELFSGPMGWFFKAVGGVPVDRSGNQNMVEQVAEIFKARPDFKLAMSPEGTRRKVDRIRTGFYYIAKKANVPIVLAGLDFSLKTLIFSEPFYPTDDEAADFAKIISFFTPIKGKYPELGMGHLADSNPASS
jgi:1-acyl-sn-glycerol-3-phosphate acyltransferase